VADALKEHWNVLAIVSFVLGLLPFVVLVAPVAAVVLGFMAKARVGETGERGGGLALWGIALGGLGFVLGLVWALVQLGL
jgi:TRAP-type mannitol/chloroaromatic compound transport system permease small subunit